MPIKEVVRVKWLKGLICGSVMGISKCVLGLGKTTIYNYENWLKHVLNRPDGTPIITVQNHISTVDDPAIWGVLTPINRMFNWDDTRFSMGANEIMFFSAFANWFFGKAGKVLPTVRGAGVNQFAVRRGIDLLNQGAWVNIFPEAKINQSGSVIPMKWGVAHLVTEVTPTPKIVPVYHTGFDKLFPEGQVYYPRVFPRKYYKIFIGEPISFEDLIDDHKKNKTKKTDLHIAITDRVYNELLAIENKVKALS